MLCGYERLLFDLIFFIFFLQIARCAYVIVFMAILWVTESLPIPVTALIPIFMFPMLEVVNAKTISGSYVTVCIIFYEKVNFHWKKQQMDVMHFNWFYCQQEQFVSNTNLKINACVFIMDFTF